MADRVQLDLLDFGERPAEPTGFEYVGATGLSRKEYHSGYVNFYNQFLDTSSPSLAEETGIKSSVPSADVIQESTIIRDDDDDIPSFLRQALTTDDTDKQPIFGLGAVKFETGAKYDSYSDYLNKTGQSDRVDIIENLYAPLSQGDFKNIDLKEANIFESIKNVPKELKGGLEDVSITFKEKGISGVIDKYGEAVGKKVMTAMIKNASGFASIPTMAFTSLLSGEVGTTTFGQQQFTPTVFSPFAHINRSKQFSDLSAMESVRDDPSILDKGFAMRIGAIGITRAPNGRSYSGNTAGMTHKQIKDLEALSKGYLPEAYRFTHDKDGQDSIFLSGGTKINQRISDDGGLMVDPNNPMAGFYKGDGTFYSPRFGYSKYGSQKDIDKLADKYDIDSTLAAQALFDARAGKGTLAGNIFKIKRDSADKDDEGKSSFVPTSKPPVPKKPVQTTGSTSMDMIQQSIQDKKDKDDEDNERKKLEDRYDDIAEQQNAKGGFIQRLAPGGNVSRVANTSSGFVDGVPPSQTTDAQEVADDRNGKLPEGAYVINASAVTFAGETDIINMLQQAQKEAVRRGVTPENPKASSMIDVAVSRGEVVVAPYLVNIIGKDRLEKINNRGIKDTERKIEENGQQTQGVSRGGFLGYATGTGTLSPTVTSPQEPYEAPPLPPTTHTVYDNIYFGYRFGDIIDAIRPVEIQGFEEQPYIFTGVKVKGRKGSSAFGPMQITASTLRDLKERSGDYQMFSDEAKEYVDKLIQQGDDKVNIELYQGIYRNDKKQAVSKDLGNKLRPYGAGVIPLEDHEKFYEIVANATLKQKLLDHDTLEDAISSYGEGLEYASKVLKNLGVLRKN